MARYTLIDPVTGEQHTLSELELTQNIRLNCILFRDQEHLGIVTHRDLVLFARWCTNETLARLKGEPNQRVAHALSLVDRWLEDEKSVTSEELEAAARAAAWAAAPAITDAAPLVAFVAARTATWTAQAAAQRAAVYGDGASNAAMATSQVSRDYTSYEAQAQWWVEHLQSGK